MLTTSRKYSILVLLLIAASVFVRIKIYGDPRLSVSFDDTPSYVNSSRVNLLSWKAFTTIRPFTTNLIYKAFTPTDDYRYIALSNIENGTSRRKIDRGFKSIAILQVSLSIIGWTMLAWIISNKLNNGLVKVTSTVLILLFGFTPQVADWDSIMSSESLSISLFVISLCLVFWLASSFTQDMDFNLRNITKVLICFVSIFFWTFTKDVNSYSLLMLIFLIAIFQFFSKLWSTKLLFFINFLLLILFIASSISTRQRPIWKIDLAHVWESDILSTPANVDYFTKLGMPQPGTTEYTQWFDEHAKTSYAIFLCTHPRFTINKFFADMKIAFSENQQNYFRANDIRARPIMILLGDYIHPKSEGVFLITLSLLLILAGHMLFQRKAELFPWVWVGSWIFLTSSAIMFLSIFGDTYGLPRHALSSTVIFRLLMWVLLFVIADILVTKQTTA